MMPNTNDNTIVIAPGRNIRALIVGGTFDNNGGKQSSVIELIDSYIYITAPKWNTECINGGTIDKLKKCLEQTKDADIVFWFANVDNSEEKIRNVKEINPRCMLITSKRNDFVNPEDKNPKRKYDFEDLLQRALATKANLCFEFTKMGDKLFNIRVFDPLGCIWYDGTDIMNAVRQTVMRLYDLKSVTRRQSVHQDGNPDITFNETDKKFLSFVRESAKTFHELMCLPKDVKRFVGNASLRFKTPTRCMNGFPAIRKDDMILMSRRNVDKTGIDEDDFVPCYLEDNGNVAYFGDNKPSVDSPVQLRLFEEFPSIDYILHGHCYIKNALMTTSPVPCGAIEEIDEIMKVAKHRCKASGETMQDIKNFVLNLKGHGCLIMSSADELDNTINELRTSHQFTARQIPEDMSATTGNNSMEPHIFLCYTDKHQPPKLFKL